MRDTRGASLFPLSFKYLVWEGAQNGAFLPWKFLLSYVDHDGLHLLKISHFCTCPPTTKSPGSRPFQNYSIFWFSSLLNTLHYHQYNHKQDYQFALLVLLLFTSLHQDIKSTIEPSKSAFLSLNMIQGYIKKSTAFPKLAFSLSNSLSVLWFSAASWTAFALSPYWSGRHLPRLCRVSHEIHLGTSQQHNAETFHFSWSRWQHPQCLHWIANRTTRIKLCRPFLLTACRLPQHQSHWALSHSFTADLPHTNRVSPFLLSIPLWYLLGLTTRLCSRHPLHFAFEREHSPNMRSTKARLRISDRSSKRSATQAEVDSYFSASKPYVRRSCAKRIKTYNEDTDSDFDTSDCIIVSTPISSSFRHTSHESTTTIEGEDVMDMNEPASVCKLLQETKVDEVSEDSASGKLFKKFPYEVSLACVGKECSIIVHHPFLFV